MLRAVVADSTINVYMDGKLHMYPKDPELSDAQNLINCIKEAQDDSRAKDNSPT